MFLFFFRCDSSSLNLLEQQDAVGDLMVFALEHADKANDVAQTIAESLTIATTPLVTKLARLYVVSDILFNSSNVKIANASFFRSAFERELPAVLSVRTSLSILSVCHHHHLFRSRLMALCAR